VHPAVEFWNQVIIDFINIAAIIREPGVFLDDENGAVPNFDNGAEGGLSLAA